MRPFANSLLVASLTSVFSLLVGLPLAILLARTDFPGKRCAECLYLLPLFIPPAIISVGWMSLAGKAGWLYGPAGCVFILTLCYFPLVTFLSIAGLRTVGGDLEDGARLHFGEMEVLRRVTIPYAANYILSGAFFVFIFALSNYEVPALLGFRTFPVEIFEQFSGFYNTRLALLYSILPAAMAVIALLAIGKLLSGRDYAAIGHNWSGPRKIGLGKPAKTAAAAFAALVLSGAISLPLAALLKNAGGAGVYLRALKLSRGELLFSLVLAAAGATAVVFLSFFAAYLLARRKGTLRNVLNCLCILPFAVPATVCGVVLIRVFNRPGLDFFYSTPLILLAGYLIRFSPLAIKILESGISRIDRSFEEEASLAGAGILRRFFQVLPPLAKEGLTASWIIVFALIMGELGLTILLIPPGTSTLILKVYTLMHYGSGKLVAAMALISALPVVIPVMIIAGKNGTFKKTLLSFIGFLLLVPAGGREAYAETRSGHLYSTWSTLETDTCASGWLIKRFVDREAEFKFYPRGELIEEGIAFDTPDAEFRRTQVLTTFETILRKHDLKDPRLIKMGAVIHDIEINYWTEKREPESEKINREILEIIRQAKSPEEAFARAFAYLDGIY